MGKNGKIGKRHRKTKQKWLVILILVSFPQILSIGAVILHESARWTWSYLVFYWPNSRNAFKKYIWCLQVKLNKKLNKSPKKATFWLRDAKNIFWKNFWRLVNKISNNSMFNVLILVKLQPQRTKSVEMGAKSVWLVIFILFFNVFFLFFNFLPIL